MGVSREHFTDYVWMISSMSCDVSSRQPTRCVSYICMCVCFASLSWQLIRAFHLCLQYGQRLRRSAGRGDVARVVELLQRGCPVNTSDGEGLSALHYACEFNKTEAIRALAAQHPADGVALAVRSRSLA